MKNKRLDAISVSILDVAILLYNLHRAAADPEVGFQDTDRSLERLTWELEQRRYPISPEILASALWSCNMMDEVGEFTSFSDKSFEQFHKRVLRYQPHLRFDVEYNQILPKEEK